MAQLLKQAQLTSAARGLAVPGLVDAAWYPMHGSFGSAVAVQPTLGLATGAGGNWNAQGYYAFPSGNSTDVANSDNSLSLDAVFSLVGMAAGHQLIVAWEQTTPNHTGTGFQWCYGQDGVTASYIAMGMINTEVLQFSVRGAGDAAARTHQWSGTPLSLTGQRCSIGVSIEAQSATEVLVRVMKRLYGTDTSGPVDLGYSALLDVRGTGSANPGRGTFVNHAGLTIGGRPTASWTPANRTSISSYSALFGNGSGNGRIGNFCARRFDLYNDSRLAAVMADLWNRPREFPESLL